MTRLQCRELNLLTFFGEDERVMSSTMLSCVDLFCEKQVNYSFILPTYVIEICQFSIREEGSKW